MVSTGVIGAVFSALGRDLLAKFPFFVDNTAELAPRLAFTGQWEKAEFREAMEPARAFPYKVRITPAALRDLHLPWATEKYLSEDLLPLLEWTEPPWRGRVALSVLERVGHAKLEKIHATDMINWVRGTP